MEYLILAVLLLMLTTIPFKKKKDLDWMKGHCAHRGIFDREQSVVENGANAIKKAIEFQLNIEVDIRITSDDVLVVYHDETTGRLFPFNQSIEQTSYHQLIQYEMGNGKERILTFDQLLQLVNNQVGLIIEIKTTPQIEKVSTLVAARLDQYQGRFSVCSFNPIIVRWFVKNRPDFIVGQIIKNFFNDKSVSLINRFLLSINGYGFYTKANFVSVEVSHLRWFLWMKWLDAFIAVWAVSNEKWIEKKQKLVDCVILEHVSLYE